MANLQVDNVVVKGVCCAVPRHKYEVEQFVDHFSPKEIKKLSNMTGTKFFYRTGDSQTTSDLCVAAAERLLDELNWSRSTIDGIIFVSQTPDYVLPASSTIIQNRLGLSHDCLAFDISLGCSGYVYGLMTASRFIGNKGCKRMLLLVGDTISKVISPEDRSVALLFGDAGSATALELDEAADAMKFIAGTNGSGADNLIIPASGFRQKRSIKTSVRYKAIDGNIRSEEELYMNGSEIFNFTLDSVPNLIANTIESMDWTKDEINYYVLHQANKYMIDYLTRKMEVPKDKVPMNIDKFGNTSSASIPLVLVDETDLRKPEKHKVILAGFGVGYSWASAALQISDLVCPDIVYV